jgi:hypothetical protein
MKTTKFFLAISLALIFAIGFNAMGGQPVVPIKKPTGNTSKTITHVVRIALANQVPFHNDQFEIRFTNGSGQLIAEPKAFVPGVSEYIFTEEGNIQGTRIASLVRLPNNHNSYYIRPVIKRGVFLGGCTYTYVIVPLPALEQANIDIH